MVIQEKSDQGLRCLVFRLYFLDALVCVKPFCLNCKIMTTFSGYRIFRIFTVYLTVVTRTIFQSEDPEFGEDLPNKI